MAFAVSILATLLLIVVSLLPEHVNGDEACEKAAINEFYRSMISEMKEKDDKSLYEWFMTSTDNGEDDFEDAAEKTKNLISEYDLTRSQNISTFTQTLVDAIIACQSTDVWQSTLEDDDEERVCDFFSYAYEENQISLPQNFPQTCPP